MFKLVVPCRGVNFLRHIAVRLNTSQKFPSAIASGSTPPSAQLIIENRRCNSSDSRIRNFYEYPDVNVHEDDVNTPYTNWEGTENRHAHSIMENSKSYDSTIAKIPVNKCQKISADDVDDLLRKNWRLEPVSKLVHSFRQISHNANENNENIYSPRYENIVKSIACNSKILDDDQLCNVLKSLALWFIEANDEDSDFSRLCTALDLECENRANSWSTEKVLLVSDHWYRLRLIRKSRFVSKSIIRLGTNPETLSPRHLVQLMFYTSVSRSKLVNFREVEARLCSSVKLLNINELAIVALGFFKSQTQIRDRKLLTMIIQRTIREIESIDEISLAAILKVVRYSVHINDLDFLGKLLENVIPQIPRLSVTCLVHVILAAANRSLFYADLLNAVTARFYREISKLRVKDIRCLVFALSSFNYVPEKQPNILKRIIEELSDSNRQDELKRFPKCFATCLHHLSILNIHPKKLIAQALDPENVQKAYGSDVNAIRREIFALDLDIETEIPDYRGPRLDTQTRENVAMRLTDAAPWTKGSQLTITDYFMLDVVKTCEEYLGSKEMVHVDHVLPQYQRPDIIVCLDNENSPIPISSTLSKLPFGSVKHPPKITSDDIKWLALIIGSSNSYAKNTNRVLGHICAKHRQLEYIGYTPFLIFWQDWRQLKNDGEKFKYLQCKVFL